MCLDDANLSVLETNKILNTYKLHSSFIPVTFESVLLFNINDIFTQIFLQNV